MLNENATLLEVIRAINEDLSVRDSVPKRVIASMNKAMAKAALDTASVATVRKPQN